MKPRNGKVYRGIIETYKREDIHQAAELVHQTHQNEVDVNDGPLVDRFAGQSTFFGAAAGLLCWIRFQRLFRVFESRLSYCYRHRRYGGHHDGDLYGYDNRHYHSEHREKFSSARVFC